MAAPTSALLLTGLAALGLQRTQAGVADAVARSFRTRQQVGQVRDDVVDAETGVRGYLLAGTEDFLGPYRKSADRVDHDVAALAAMVKDDPLERRAAATLAAAVDERMARLAGLLSTAATARPPVDQLAASRASMDEVRAVLGAMDATEARRLASRVHRQRVLGDGVEVLLAGLVLLGLGGGVAAALLLGNGVARRLEDVEANAGRLSDEQPLRPAPPGKDEVGRLGLALEQASALLAERSGRLRSVQRFLDHLIASSPVVAVRAALPEGDILYVSPNVRQVFGFDAAEVVGQRGFFRERLNADELAGLEAAVGEALRLGQSDYEFRLTDGRGADRWVHARMHVDGDEEGRPSTLLGYLTDVDERRRLSDAIAWARDQAVAASRLKSEFVATMSHEIRTPLNGVIGMTGLLLDTDLTAEQRDYAEAAKASGEALLGVINDILDFSKIEAGKLELEMVDLGLRSVVEQAMELLAEPAYERGLELATLVDPDVPDQVRGDPGRLRQILLNLVSNAVKFTERGEVVVRVMRACPSGQPGVVRFEVTDTGIGISADEQSRLFQSFVQADASTTRRFGGTGLGLTICRQLVELMGGHIGVTSTPGEGSTFWFTIAFQPAARPAAEPAAAETASLEGLTALAVDDSATNRVVLDQSLRSWGMRPTVTHDGEDALARLRAAAGEGHPFAVALVDHHMPGLDGVAMARAVRSDPALAGTRLILLTSSGRRYRGTGAGDAGVDAVLTKPIRPSTLLDALVTVLQATATPAPASPAPGRRPATRAHVLVVEDNAVNQKVAVRMLEKLGYRADVAANGREAVDAVERVPYAAVLMDCQMPQMDGYEATAEIRRRRPAGAPHLPIIAMTAGAMQGDEERALSAGMDGFVTKPVRPAALLTALDRWLTGAPAPGGGDVPAAGHAGNVLDSGILAGLRVLEERGQVGFLRELVHAYLEEADSRIDELRAAAEAGEHTEVALVAHALRGSSANLAAARLATLCARAEELANAGGEGLGAVVDRVAGEFALVRDALLACTTGGEGVDDEA